MKTTRIYWPNDIRGAGICIGWQQEDCIIIAAVLEDTNLTSLEAKLKVLQTNSRWLELEQGCKTLPTLVGRSIAKRQKNQRPHFTVEDARTAYYKHVFIFYGRPDLANMQFFTLEPLDLDITNLGTESQSNLTYEYPLPHNLAGISAANIRLLTRQLNASRVIQDVLDKSPAWSPFPLPPLLRVLSPFGTILARLLVGVSSLCDLPLSFFSSQTSFKDISASLQQMDVRQEQLTFFPSQIQLIHRRSREHVAQFSAQYINFYNSIWLIFNDIVVGTAVGGFLYENRTRLAARLEAWLQLYTVNWIREALLWLDNWPVGLKLNTELSRFLSLAFLLITETWAFVLQLLVPHLPMTIGLVSFSGYAGLTMILSLCSDALSVATLHISLSYLAATAICRRLLSISGSLWNLFRGKRYNALRNRVDSWEYSVDQLLLGTMLFTLVTFLSPTIVVYYFLFVLARLAIISIHALLETLLAFMNHFPLFVLMLRIKDPLRLPGGIKFVVGTETLELKNTPVPFYKIFFQHLLLWSRLSAHYSPLRLLRCVFTARLIVPIPRYSIRYSMIPSSTSRAKPKPKLD